MWSPSKEWFSRSPSPIAIISSPLKPLKLISTCRSVKFLMKVLRHFHAESAHSKPLSPVIWRNTAATSSSFFSSAMTQARREAPPPTPPNELKERSSICTVLFSFRALASAMAPLALILFQWSCKVCNLSLLLTKSATRLAPWSVILFIDALKRLSVLIRPESYISTYSSSSSSTSFIAEKDFWIVAFLFFTGDFFMSYSMSGLSFRGSGSRRIASVSSPILHLSNVKCVRDVNLCSS